MGTLDRKAAEEQNERILEYIRAGITSGKYPPNQKINQAEVANELGVSRTPVIKALGKLESEMLVNNVPNSGYFVREYTLKDMLETYEIRQSIEMVAVYKAAKKAKPEDIEELKSCFRPFEGKEKIDVDDYVQADKKFHAKLLTFCDNERLNRINNAMNIMVWTYNQGLIRDPEITLSEHQLIINAVEKGDAFLAKELMMEHIQFSLDRLNTTCLDLEKMGISSESIPYSNIPKI